MRELKAIYRAYYKLQGSPAAQQGYCTVLAIDGTHAAVVWEKTGRTRSVELRDLLTVAQAKERGYS
jgi:hypothetical protein